MAQHFDVLICGGGIADLTLADRLHAQGHRSLVIERAPALRGEGYMIDFFGAGYAVAEKMGMLPQLEAIHYQIPSLRFLDDSGRQRLSLNYANLRKVLNGRHFNFMRGIWSACSMSRSRINWRCVLAARLSRSSRRNSGCACVSPTA